METWELVARESIRDLVARYNASGDAGRFETMLELFTDDAVLVVPDGTHQGRENIRVFFESVAIGNGRRPGGRLIRHFTATHQIDVLDPDAARGRCYYQVLTDAGLDHWGRYVDRYRRTDAGWRFQERQVSIDGTVPGGWAADRLKP
ncbi:MAG: nuclear transport factor 2 family protein [Deltaproteobacteria bacterium]|nr:MAG: nuclear transport factor 2 family protein [Deltaproteobacteria bacterium]TDJ21269.1 MAG: nuclear transport factor 2 family protein [Deltaproteobacteria bacterium]